MDEELNIRVGDIVLVDKDVVSLGGCLVLVTELRAWGVLGQVMAPDDEFYPVRVGFEEIANVYRLVT